MTVSSRAEPANEFAGDDAQWVEQRAHSGPGGRWRSREDAGVEMDLQKTVSRRLRRYRIVGGVLLFLEIVKHVVLFASGPAPLIGDARHYWKLGGHVEEKGDWGLKIDRNAYRTPGYPYYVGVCRRIGGKYGLAVALGLQHLLVIGTSVLAGFVAMQIFRTAGSGERGEEGLPGMGHGAAFAENLGRERPSEEIILIEQRSLWVGLTAYAATAISLVRAYYANVLITETMYTFSLLVYVLLVVRYHRELQLKWAIWAGIVLGVMSLVRPVGYLLWVPVGGSFLWHVWPRRVISWQEMRAHLGWMMVGTVVLLGPWYIRNWGEFGRPFLTSFTARNLWIVCFQPGEGAGFSVPNEGAGKQIREMVLRSKTSRNLSYTWDVTYALHEAGLNDDQAERLMGKACRQVIFAEPGKFCWLTIKRFVNFWRTVVQKYPYFGGPNETDFQGQPRWGAKWAKGIAEPILSRSPARSVWWNTLVAAAGLAGVILLVVERETRVIGIVIVLVIVYFNAITAIVEIPHVRYRFILEPVVYAAATAGYFRRVFRAGAS